MKNKFYPPWYRIEIDGPNVYIYSDHPRSKGRELSLWHTKDGYLRTKLNNKSVKIHCLVAELYLGKRPKGKVINHKDGNKENNHPDNLEYCTQAENIKHAVEHGMHVANNPENHGNYKDGRSVKERRNQYKREWYHKNKERLKREKKMGWKYERKT